MNNEFTQIENDLLTDCWDDKARYYIKIDAANQVVAFNKETNKPVHIFGTINKELVVKLLKYMEIDSIETDARVIKTN